jgi:hypothetical protein
MKEPAKALLAPVPRVHLESAYEDGLTTVLFGSEMADLFWEREVTEGAAVYIYESLDDYRPVGESLVRWTGSFARYLFRDQLTIEDEKQRPPSTRDEGRWTLYWEVSNLRRLDPSEEFPVSDLSTEDGRRISPAFVPHGPTPVAG